MHFNRIAQMPPAPEPAAPAGPLGAAPAGPSPMPPMGGAPPAMPTAMPGAAPDPKREEIGSPLDTLGQVLYDVDAPSLIAQMTGSSPDEIALYIWETYGGNKMGGADKDKIGARLPKSDVEPEQEEAEQKATENSRWRRLPQGKRISDITTLDELISTMKGLMINAVKNENKKNAPQGAPPMPMAETKHWVRLAQSFDNEGIHILADMLDGAIKRIL